MKKIQFKRVKEQRQRTNRRNTSLRFYFTNNQQNLQWNHYLSDSKELIDFLMKILPNEDQDEIKEFIQDAIEEQRPRFQTRKDLILFVLAIPTNKILESNNYITQITFFISQNHLVTVSNEDRIIEQIYTQVVKDKEQIESFTELINYIIMTLVDKYITYLEDLDSWVTQIQMMQSSSRLSSRSLKRILEIKGRFFETSRLVKADTEVIMNLLEYGAQIIDQETMGRYPLDRFMYGLDLIESLREDLGNIINLHLSLDNQYLNEHLYNITILATLFVVPSIISGIFGMNVALPNISFLQVMLLTVFLTGLAYYIMNMMKPEYLKTEIEI